ncbi:MAG: hypothetical protein AABY26_07055 [Nanoarchaeota archaeon]
MGLFKFRNREQDSELEKALYGVPFSGDVQFSYNGKGPEKDKVVTSPVYLLQVDVQNSVGYGCFIISGKVAEALVGFSRKNNFLSKEYFRPDLKGNLVKENGPQDGTLYLPLKLTDLVLAIGITTDGKFVPHVGSPVPLFGIEGIQGTYPLILVSETEEGIKCKGLYKAKDGQLLTYDHQPMRPLDQEIKTILNAQLNVKFSD